MQELFAAVPKNLRRARLVEYKHYLEERDGAMNIEERTLSRREESIKRFETPPTFAKAMDEAEFRARYRSYEKGKQLDPEMLLLLALVKVNASEAYGVAVNFQRTMARALENEDDAELRILCEEVYHTRILLSSANLYGIVVDQPYRPPTALRVVIGGIATLPMVLARSLTLAGEIIATLMFAKLLGVARRVLAHAPEIRDSIEERLLEIYTDERGHISYNRLHSGSLELAQARLILPMTARTIATVFPEVVALGAFPVNVLDELPLIADPKLVPERVRRESFVA